MVLPMGAPMQDGNPPPEQLTKYRPLLIGVAILYGALIIFLLILQPRQSNALFYLCMVVITLQMACRPAQCLMPCLLFFFILSAVNAVFDAMQLITIVINTKPRISDFFSTSCFFDLPLILPKGTMIYGNGTTPVKLTDDTPLLLPDENCSPEERLFHITLVFGVVVDLVATAVGYMMRKTATQLMAAEMMGEVDPGQGFGAQTADGQRLGAPLRGARNMGNEQGPGFTVFQGTGQTLNS